MALIAAIATIALVIVVITTLTTVTITHRHYYQHDHYWVGRRSPAKRISRIWDLSDQTDQTTGQLITAIQARNLHVYGSGTFGAFWLTERVPSLMVPSRPGKHALQDCVRGCCLELLARARLGIRRSRHPFGRRREGSALHRVV